MHRRYSAESAGVQTSPVSAAAGADDGDSPRTRLGMCACLRSEQLSGYNFPMRATRELLSGAGLLIGGLSLVGSSGSRPVVVAVALTMLAVGVWQFASGLRRSREANRIFDARQRTLRQARGKPPEDAS